MATLKLKHVERFKDRYGKIRFYYREGKGQRTALVGVPGTEPFETSYKLAAKTYVPIGTNGVGTFNALAVQYYRSVKFLKTKPSSQDVMRGIVDKFCTEHGHRLVKQMTYSDVDKILASKVSTPAAANNLLKKLRVLMKLAIKIGWIDRDPTIGAEKFKEGTHHTWTESEIRKFEMRWPLGSRERIAFDFHLYTGQRRGDVCSLTPSSIEIRSLLVGDVICQKHFIHLTQEKTGAELVIPMHPNLARSFNLWRGVGDTIIAQANGERYAVASYGNLMADAIAEARLPVRCVLHGLKKAAGRRLAEAGCTVHQIAAILGNVSLEEIERYTKAANQGLLADQAMASLGNFQKA